MSSQKIDIKNTSYFEIDLPEKYVPPPKKVKDLSGLKLLYYLKYSREKFEEKPYDVHKKRIIHPIMQGIFKLSRIISGIKVIKINCKLPNTPSDRHIIYTISHVGKDDQAVFNEIKTRHYTILSGDYESLYNNIEGQC